ncbi:MAG: protein-glutamate O-methyltransferase CheR [bacterium]
MIDISASLLARFRDFIYGACGLWFGDTKIAILSNRLKMRMKARGVHDPDAYYSMISNPDDKAELELLINLITTNETYFYRCETQMATLAAKVIPEIAKKKLAADDRRIRIWSAGCSTGEEPYSIAICLQESLPFRRLWDVRIYATDISTEVLMKAMEARYNRRAVAGMPEELLKRYFAEADGCYSLRGTIKNVVDFEYLNLVDAVYETGFDLIFCRNVLIYFRDETKTQILEKFYNSLVDGGYLFLGPSEMVRGLAKGFKMLVMKDSVVFRKEPG